MDRELTTMAEPKNKRSTAEAEHDYKRDLCYLDAQALTRDCIMHELARRMPDFNILAYADVEELIASGDSRLQTAAAVILFVHADRLNHHINGGREQIGIGTELR